MAQYTVTYRTKDGKLERTVVEGTSPISARNAALDKIQGLSSRDISAVAQGSVAQPTLTEGNIPGQGSTVFVLRSEDAQGNLENIEVRGENEDDARRQAISLGLVEGSQNIVSSDEVASAATTSIADAQRRALEEQKRLDDLAKKEEEDRQKELASRDAASILQEPMTHTVDLVTGSFEVTRNLVEQKVGNGGIIYRRYFYDIPSQGAYGESFKGNQYFVVNADEASNTTDPYNHEVAVSRDAFIAGKAFANLNADDLAILKPIASDNPFGIKGTDEDANIPNWLITTMRLNNNSIARVKETGEYRTVTNDAVSKATIEGQIPEIDTSLSADAPLQGPLAPGEFVDRTPLATTEVEKVENLAGDELTSFAGNNPVAKMFQLKGIEMPLNQDGTPKNVDGITALPGFPTELLEPGNLFVKVTESQTLEDGTKALFTRYEVNPAIDAALEIYGNQVSSATGLQASSDDILQAQVSATGGLLGGPAGSLSINQLEDIERSSRTIAATGGLMTSVATGTASAEGVRDFVDRLTPLGRQELTQEALSASGGLIGGYYQPTEVTDPLTGEITTQDQFVQGFSPQELLAQQQSQELRRIQAQNIPSVLQAQLEAQQLGQQQSQAEAQRRAGILGQLADIYSNPAQLAAIVRSGGNPLAQLQNELNRALPVSGTSPLNIPENLLNMPTGAVGKIPADTPIGNGTPTQTTTPVSVTDTSSADLAMAQRNIASTINVNDPQTGERLKMRASSSPGQPEYEVDPTDPEGRRVRPVQGAFYTIEKTDGTTEERFIRNSQLGNYGVSDPLVFNTLASNANYAGPPKEFFGLTDESITTALTEAGRIPAPTPPLTSTQTTGTPVTTATAPTSLQGGIPIYNPMMTEADIPTTNIPYQQLLGAAAARGFDESDIRERASDFTPGAGDPLQGYLGGSPLGERSGIL